LTRPVLYVLAGVNGAGKSSIGGHLLHQAGLAWFNPDAFARELIAATGCDQQSANARAWDVGMRRLDQAVRSRSNYAFETTLGGKTVTAKILKACKSHDVLIWFCGLPSPELHIARVQSRVNSGGHPIPAEKIRERYPKALLNLISLMPHASHIVVYDNSKPASEKEIVPDPLLVLSMEEGRLLSPAADDLNALQSAPDWAKPLLEAALRNTPPKRR
jgi:predicted ABC-type ATPase